MTTSPPEGKGNVPGIYYTESGTRYEVPPLTVLRFQRLLSVMAAVPLDKLIAALLPEDGEAEIGLGEVGAAIFEILPLVDSENFIVSLVAIALDIDATEAEGLPIEIGASAISHLFTTNLESLQSSPNFSAIEKGLKRQSASRRTRKPATRKSSPGSGKSSTDTATMGSSSTPSSAGSPGSRI